MKRKLLVLTLTGMLMITAGSLTAFAEGGRDGGGLKPNLVPVPGLPGPAGIDVWTNHGDGAVLVPGQTVDVFFRTRQDAYVVLVNIDTRGRARLLFPERGHDDGFVRGGWTVAVPGPGARYRLQVTGPFGTERIVAFASDVPLVDHWRSLVDGGYHRTSIRKPRLSLRGAVEANLGGTVEVAARGRYDTQLRRTPVRDRAPVCGTRLVSDETWFEVGRRWRRHY